MLRKISLTGLTLQHCAETDETSFGLLEAISKSFRLNCLDPGDEIETLER